MNTNETTKMTVTEVTNMSAELPEMGWDDPAILREDTKKAKAHSKEFIKNNRTRKIVISSNAMNEYDEKDGKWKTIDNTLVEKEDEYESRLGKFKAKIKKSEKRRGVEVVGDGMMLSWEFLGREKDGEKNEDNEKHEKKKSSLKVTPKKKNFARGNVESNARYENCEDDLDIEYVLQSNNIKENIIIRKKENSYRYRFAFTLEGLTMRLAEDQSSLEIFSCATDENGVPCEKREFTIPAPFMFDKAGERSDEVQFELEETDAGKYTFTVVANENWINDANRTFPVTIDPQLVTNNTNFLTATQFNSSCDTCGGGNTCECNTDMSIYHVEKSGCSIVRTVFKINKRLMGFPWVSIGTTKILSAYLVFSTINSISEDDRNKVSLSGIKPEIVEHRKIRFDITHYIKRNSDEFSLELMPGDEDFSCYLVKDGSNAPYVELEYTAQRNDRPTKKSFSLVGGAECVVDLQNKDHIITLPVTSGNDGIAISQIHKINNDNFHCGTNFRLSLNEKLVKNETSSLDADYVYTDAHGDVHLFKEVFYFINKNGKKVTLDKSIVSVDTDGSLFYSITTNGVETRYDVVKDNVSDSGWEAITRLNDVKNIELLEQRSDEEKQLEEQTIAYEDTLKSFVIVNEETGEKGKSIGEMCEAASEKCLSEVIAQSKDFTNPPNGKLVLTESDFINFKSAIEQKASLDFQKESLEKQKTTLREQQEALERQKKSIVLQLYNVLNATTSQEMYKDSEWNSDIKTETLKNLYLQFKEIGSIKEEEKEEKDLSITDQIINTIEFSKKVDNIQSIESETEKENIQSIKDDWDLLQSFNNDSSLCIKTTSIAALNEQLKSIKEQEKLITNQIDLYNQSINQYKTPKSSETFAKYYKEYVNLKAQLDSMRRHSPVNYLRKDGIIKGFNENGDLVVIFDSYGNYYALNYDTRIVNGTEHSFITAVTDNNERTTTLNYDANLLLTSIITPNGKRTEYAYSDNRIVQITYPDGERVYLSYSDGSSDAGCYIKQINSSLDMHSLINCNTDGKIIIKNVSTIDLIKHDSLPPAEGYHHPNTSSKILSEMTLVYEPDKTTITDEVGNQEIYVFDTDPDCLKEFYSVINGKVASAEKYTYSDNDFDIVEYAHKGSLNLREYSDYTFISDKYTCAYYDDYRRVIREESSWKRTTICVGHPKVITNHTYDDAHHLVKSVSEIFHEETFSPAYLSVTTYQYNDKGSLTRKENYVEGTQLTEGITVEEHEYDDTGRELKTITYNTLDASSKFHTEKEYDNNGKLIAEPDATGEHKTSYNYSANDDSLRSEQLPNGSKFAYGYDTRGNLTAVSQSTEDGEENCNNTVYTYDVPTEVTSGNNTVRYTYDGKRRIKSVELNGAKDYVTYNYTDATADTPESTVTTVLGDPSSTCSITTTVTQNSRDNNKTITQRTKKLNVNGILVDKEKTVSFDYDNHNRMIAILDRDDNSVEEFGYDTLDNLTSYRYNDGSINRVTESCTYNTDHQLSEKAITANGTTQTYTYTYKNDTAKSLDSITLDSYMFAPKTDCLSRNKGKTISFITKNVDGSIASNPKIAEEQITYLKFGDHATNIPATIYYGDKKNGSYAFSDHFKYKYDSMGNIAEIRENGELYAKYAYDTIGRLVREDNKKLGKTVIFTYDTNGNILCRKEYAFTLTDKLDELECTTFAYTYDGDKMLSYNGEACVYDTIGNPTTYCNKTLIWENGRQLSSYDNTTFTYDNLGRRTAKNGTSFTYDASGNLIHQSNGISFIYDASGVCGICHGNSTYFYRKDILGNIVAILDANGEIVAKYTYDAWGNHSITATEGNETIANLNPFRYRGYYYDVETELYFLKTRYYDPEIGRFITIDDISYLDPDSINGLNLYAYCGNNPVMCVDPSGTFAFSTFLIGLAISSLVTWVAGEVFGHQLVGGIGSAIGGWSAITTGISLLAYGPVGWVIGGIAIIAGTASMAFGTAEVQEHFTGNNWIKDTLGWNDSLYNGLYFASNIVATLASVGGNIYRSHMTSSGLGQAAKTPQKPYSRYYQIDNMGKVKSVTQFNKFGLPKYRIDIKGRPHNGLLPHKHLFSWNSLGQRTGEDVKKVFLWLWKILGNWR